MSDSNKQSNGKAEKIGAGVAAGGTVAGIGGAAIGASAPTITWALGAIGGIVGGGMAAGLVLVAAAPVAAAGLGYVAVKGVKALKNRKK